MAAAPAQGLKRRHKRPLDLTDLAVDDGARANISLSFLCLSPAGSIKVPKVFVLDAEGV